ncbi:hypothetical protein TorRG33x02_077040, partial [Trema orientale]
VWYSQSNYYSASWQRYGDMTVVVLPLVVLEIIGPKWLPERKLGGEHEGTTNSSLFL